MYNSVATERITENLIILINHSYFIIQLIHISRFVPTKADDFFSLNCFYTFNLIVSNHSIISIQYIHSENLSLKIKY